MSPRYRGWHDAVSLRIGRAKSCYTGRCGCILYMSLPGATTSSLERLGQSFSTSVHHDIGLPYIHLRAVHPPTYSTLLYSLEPAPAAFGISHNDLSVNRNCLWEEVLREFRSVFNFFFVFCSYEIKYCYELWNCELESFL